MPRRIGLAGGINARFTPLSAVAPQAPLVETPIAPYAQVTTPVAVSGAVGYVLYWGTRSGYYTNRKALGNTRTAYINSLTNGQVYFYAFTSVAADGSESDLGKEGCFYMPLTTAGKIKYVRKDGSDANNGNTDSPSGAYLTIQKAIDNATFGTLVYVHAGQYDEKLIWTNTKCGQAGVGQSITFMAFPGETVTIGTSGLTFSGGEPHVWFNNARYMQLLGFKVDSTNCIYAGIYAGSLSDHLNIYLNEPTKCGGSGIFMEPFNGAGTPRVINICSNHVHDNVNGGITIYKGDGLGYLRIADNTVHDNTTSSGANFDGIQVGSQGGGTNHVVVRNNEIYNEGNTNGADLLDLGGHTSPIHHYLVEKNYLHNPTGFGHFKCNSGDPGTGVGYTAGTSGFHIVRDNRMAGLLWDMYDSPNPVYSEGNTWYDGKIWTQQGSFGGVVAPVTYGDSTYATWKAAKSLSDTDTGRFTRRNEIFWNENGAANPSIQHIAPVSSGTIASQRWMNNAYRSGGSDTFSWDGGTTTAAMTTAGLTTFSGTTNTPETNSFVVTNTASQCFRDAANGDFRLISSSPFRNRAAASTTTLAAGTNTTTVIVDRASVFCDGYPTSGAELMTNPDVIKIGNNTPVAISAIDDSTNTITLASPLTFNAGDPVRRCLYRTSTGAYTTDPSQMITKTDMGAFQWISDNEPLPPSGFPITNVLTPA